MQHNVVLQQIIMQNPIMVYYIPDVHECMCHLHMIFLEGNKLSLPFHIGTTLNEYFGLHIETQKMQKWAYKINLTCFFTLLFPTHVMCI
jgi:hypothetical protein